MLLEKIYISVTKWTVFITTTIAVVVAILGTIYASKLYYDSKNTDFDRTYYHMKDPKVNFDEVMDTDKERVARFKNLKIYVYSIIQNGSQGHGYAMGAMQKNILKDNKAIEVAAYVANRLNGDVPNSFSSCTQCHGMDGRGNNGAAPSLLSLPIYNHQRALVTFNTKENETDIEKEITTKRILDLRAERTPQQIILDQIMTNINKYALKTGQDGTSRDGLTALIRQSSGNLLENYMDDYLNQLLPATHQLLTYGHTLSQKERFGISAMNWRTFIREFSKKFMKDIKEELSKEYHHSSEQNKLENDKINRAIVAQSQLMVVGMTIGGAIMLFLLLTLILIFIKVERNTRKDTLLTSPKTTKEADTKHISTEVKSDEK